MKISLVKAPYFYFELSKKNLLLVMLKKVAKYERRDLPDRHALKQYEDNSTTSRKYHMASRDVSRGVSRCSYWAAP